ncbi:putative serine/threonine protein phosphatase type 5 [Trypanosoma grayi]|uniref:putative serine/threonine protein phosphatase type 5 n=1 Tax=Trypanosoma grayi TaxID=71804 RepID=UPI0004F3F211|nr:putative serine/threonine protein phosphatase type 5 [Trypanosoma grayi]KEG12902.1 putative serine/threonine protein phosphatase type 5 [Trypanosoma grayi]
MSTNQHEGMAPSRQEVEEWLERIDEITASVEEILNEDPMEAAQRRQEREALRRENEAKENREKVKMRYDPRYYTRFENDEVIDKLLKEVDQEGGKRLGACNDTSCYSRAERVSLEETLRLKEEAARAVKAAEWEKAHELYTTAITLNTVDEVLQRTLRNNRALVQLKLKHYLDAVDDTSYVLQGEPRNMKALLRRSTALRHLHRPVDALKDAETALQREPTSKEAVELAHWLLRAKKEHGTCAVFQHHHPEEAKRLKDAVGALTTAVAVLREAHAKHTDENHGEGEAEQDNENVALVQAAENVRLCLMVIQSFHCGAAMLFVLFNGMPPLTELVCALLCNGGKGLFGSVGDDTGVRMSTSRMVFVVSARLLALILLGSETGADELELSTVTDLSVNLAEALASAIKQESAVNREGAAKALTIAILQLLEGLAVRFPVQVHTHCGAAIMMAWDAMSKRQPDPSLLFVYCGVLEALLKEPSVTVAFTEVARGRLPHVVKMALTTGPEQLQEAGLSLAVRASYASRDWAKAMSSLDFNRLLVALLPPPQKGCGNSLSPRTEEGLYALVYNLFLQSESRSQYVEQWRFATDPACRGEPSFALRTWRSLCDRVLSNGASTGGITARSKMMGVISKFFPHDESLRVAMLEGEETLWSILEAAIASLEEASSNAVSDAASNDTDRVSSEAVYMELVEHVTTCLASFYSRGLLPKEKGLASRNRIAVLLRIIRCAGDQHMVALGNAALLGSLVPPTGCDHWEALQGVKVLLEGLRGVREAIFALEHDGKKGTARWTHAQAAQKNLAIALSRCCAEESQRERLRELKGFETLHAVLEQVL